MSMSIEKSHERVQMEFKRSLEDLGFVRVRAVSSKDGDVRALFKVSDEAKWLALMTKMLSTELDKDWYTFYGKRFFLLEDKLVYGWCVILDADDIQKAVDDFRAMLIENAEKLGLLAGEPKKAVDAVITVDAATGFALGKGQQARITEMGKRTSMSKSDRDNSQTGILRAQR